MNTFPWFTSMRLFHEILNLVFAKHTICSVLDFVNNLWKTLVWSCVKCFLLVQVPWKLSQCILFLNLQAFVWAVVRACCRLVESSFSILPSAFRVNLFGHSDFCNISQMFSKLFSLVLICCFHYAVNIGIIDSKYSVCCSMSEKSSGFVWRSWFSH